MDVKSAVELRNKLNKKRPHFHRQDYHIRMKVEDDIWRRPRGRHSKMRERRVGKHKRVEIGYRGPEIARGLHASGLRIVKIESFADFERANPKEEIAIMGNIGMKKRLMILKKAVEKGLKFTNIRDAKKYLADAEMQMKLKKEKKLAEAKDKEQKKKEKPKEKETEKKTEAKEKIETKKEEQKK